MNLLFYRNYAGYWTKVLDITPTIQKLLEIDLKENALPEHWAIDKHPENPRLKFVPNRLPHPTFN